MKIGVFGGTFDPVHNGHLGIAEAARSSLNLEEVLVIPAGEPWLKAGQRVTAACHRMAMVELAVAGHPFLRASDIETQRDGPTYTVDTLAELHRRLGPGTDLYLVLGIDSLIEIGRWHQPRRLFELSSLVGIARPGSAELDPRALDAISPGASGKIKFLDGPMLDVSAATLRRRVSQGRSIADYVPEAVEEYIQKHGLYRDESTSA
jgi:nicotinate-nucleotide adenylyltransferase